MTFQRGRFSVAWYWHARDWWPSFHCTGCCYFWLAIGPLTIGVVR